MEISRRSYRYRPAEQPENDLLRAKLHEIAQEAPRLATGPLGPTSVGRGGWSTTNG